MPHASASLHPAIATRKSEIKTSLPLLGSVWSPSCGQGFIIIAVTVMVIIIKHLSQVECGLWTACRSPRGWGSADIRITGPSPRESSSYARVCLFCETLSLVRPHISRSANDALTVSNGTALTQTCWHLVDILPTPWQGSSCLPPSSHPPWGSNVSRTQCLSFLA